MAASQAAKANAVRMEKAPKYSRVPSPSELAAFSGMHCSVIYREALATAWRCPSCQRNAHELVRWTEIKGPSWRERFGDAFGMGFTITFAHHHCHSASWPPRFPRTLICGDCNSADGAAKRKLALPADWTFTPTELAQFVKVPPFSGRTAIDYEIARKIYETARHGT